MATIRKLFAIVLLLAASIAMTAAPAAATGPHHAPGAAVPMQHCPEQTPGHDVKGGMVECTMACSAALPAADWPLEEPLRIASAPIEPTDVHVLYGLHLDPATPPPKRS
jgi:hypothetical protein